jgi:hypothetical protein
MVGNWYCVTAVTIGAVAWSTDLKRSEPRSGVAAVASSGEQKLVETAIGATAAPRGDRKNPNPKHSAVSGRAEFQDGQFDGRVTAYRASIERMLGLKLVDGVGKDLLVLETSDGRSLPILPTPSARFFYNDARMHGRPMRLRARQYANVPGLEILSVRSLKDGQPHEIYYWCNVCSIKHYHDQACTCCQGPLEIHEEPIKSKVNSN